MPPKKTIKKNSIKDRDKSDKAILRNIKMHLTILNRLKENNQQTSKIYISRKKTVLDLFSKLSKECRLDRAIAFAYGALNSNLGQNMDYSVLMMVIETYKKTYGAKKKTKKKTKKK